MPLHSERRSSPDNEKVEAGDVYQDDDGRKNCNVSVQSEGRKILMKFVYLRETERVVRYDDDGRVRPRVFKLALEVAESALRRRRLKAPKGLLNYEYVFAVSAGDAHLAALCPSFAWTTCSARARPAPFSFRGFFFSHAHILPHKNGR